MRRKAYGRFVIFFRVQQFRVVSFALAVFLPPLLLPCLCSATPITGFEQFSDGEQIINQIAGLTFTNATVVTAGISLNELEFPPHSGSNVAFDDGGPIGISFASPIAGFSGYFTYATGLSIVGYASNVAVTQTSSAFSSNLAISGDPGSAPNEFLSVFFPSGIDSLLITGDAGGSSFVMDDLSSQPLAATTTAEPAELPLLGAGLGIILALRRRYQTVGEQSRV